MIAAPTTQTSDSKHLDNLASSSHLHKLLFALALSISFAATLQPTLRSGIQELLLPNGRKILSKATSDFGSAGSSYTVVKVKTRDSMFLEVYTNVSDGSQQLLERLQLGDQKDGYFDFNGHPMNLAIDDIDNDGKPEILAPSFDSNLVGHLNVFHFDPASKLFERVIN